MAEKYSAPPLTLQIEANKSFNRSVNASCVCGIIGKIAGNLGKNSSGLLDTTRAWYLQGYFESLKYPKSYIRDYFMMTVAHESGHPVLASYAYKSTGLNNYSWVHKGSSKGITSGYSLPQIGEKGYEKEPFPLADLMKYYEHAIDLHTYYATEYDVKSLLWLSKLTTGD
ncbi:hypothetical protein HYE55_10365 [Aggregatibacter actinomycetemcomitans]|nr:hypothetical protein [Aggregatibacter actinomycetemcomitans]MBN6082436.1 hypothetical protein [Aggregatibacter actinomycetemcomitans]MBN6084573.1 hypothetical protein [Aggregatibacter actinomycetemcomitans]